MFTVLVTILLEGDKQAEGDSKESKQKTESLEFKQWVTSEMNIRGHRFLVDLEQLPNSKLRDLQKGRRGRSKPK